VCACLNVYVGNVEVPGDTFSACAACSAQRTRHVHIADLTHELTNSLARTLAGEQGKVHFPQTLALMAELQVYRDRKLN